MMQICKQSESVIFRSVNAKPTLRQHYKRQNYFPDLPKRPVCLSVDVKTYLEAPEVPQAAVYLNVQFCQYYFLQKHISEIITR